MKVSIGMRILLVEDDMEISLMLSDYLRSENFEIEPAYDGKEACEKIATNTYDLVLLDLMIPQVSGIDVLQNIRKNSTVPVIIVSAKDTDVDKILGLGLGADDYITKPFSVTEVLARIKANIRRTMQYDSVQTDEPTVIEMCGLSLNLNDYTLTKREESIELTAKEFQILKLLMQNPKRVYTKEQIYYAVWNDAYMGDENAVNVHMSRLRNKIEDDPHKPQIIITIWGIGYKLGELK